MSKKVKSGFLLRTKPVSIYHDKDNVEVYFHLGGKRGVYMSIDKWTDNSWQVTVRRAVNGCPGGIPADFMKVYRRSRGK